MASDNPIFVDDWSEMDRDRFPGPVHFTCCGTTDALCEIPKRFARDGDTASATDTDRSRTLLLRCFRGVVGVAWRGEQEWTPSAAAERKKAACAVLVVGSL